MYKTAKEYAEPLELAKEAFRLAFPEIFDGMKKGEVAFTLSSMMQYIQPYATHISIQQEQQMRWNHGPQVVAEIPGPEKEPKDESMPATDLVMINYLLEHQDVFDEKTQDFICSLGDGYEQYHSFTPKQLPHVIRLYQKAILAVEGG
jgi:hypothetical protein